MTDLASWLLAQITDDEAAVRAIMTRVEADPGSFVTLGLAHPELAAGDCPSDLGEYDPARVLADCAAKRAIVELHKPRLKGFVMGRPGESREQMHDRWNNRTEMVCPTCLHKGAMRATAPCLTLRLLAEPYADRAGWDPAWKVET